MALVDYWSQTGLIKAEEAPKPGWVNRIMMGGMMGGGGMGTLQALLTEMNGLAKPRGLINRIRKMFGFRPKPPPKYRILHIMATNMPNALDEAMLRPGRIDRIYKVGYPSKEGRKQTIVGYLEKVDHQLTPEQVEHLAVITPYYSGASIKDLVNEALIIAVRAGRESIEWPDVWRAKSLKELGPPEDVDYIQRERHAVAVHEASHAVTAHLLGAHRRIDMVSIEKRASTLGMVKSMGEEERFTQWRSEFESDIMVSLASLQRPPVRFDGGRPDGGRLRHGRQPVLDHGHPIQRGRWARQSGVYRLEGAQEADRGETGRSLRPGGAAARRARGQGLGTCCCSRGEEEHLR
jgi:hypothetical protein